ncbi:MAG TPA: YbhB/YbcL family Raf kinase inhibitor-like protein [Candidatus Paceibacterota bacterium]
MTRWITGVILLVAVAAAAWGLLPRKEHAPAVLSPVPTSEDGERKESKEITMQEIKVASSAFGHNGMIPAKYTCDGEDRSPALEISGIPTEAKSLMLIMHDPDAPRSGGWTHWITYNIKLQNENSKMIREGKEPGGVAGKGTGGNTSYMGPCPPSGTHRYFFTVYALDAELSLKEGATKADVEKAMEGHVIREGELVGLYSRKKI